MNSNSFSRTRLWALICRNVVENKRRLLMSAGVVFGLTLMIFILITKSFSSGSIEYVIENNYARAAGIAFAFMWLSMIAMALSGSLTFSSYNSKARRISNLMLPASQSEKFTANVAIYIVAGNIALLLCMLLADCLSALIFDMQPAVSFLPVKHIFGSAEKFEASLAAGLGILWIGLFSQSLYVAGSALWPRYSFAKTFVALLALQILLPIILPLDFIGWSARHFFDMFEGLSETGLHIAGWCLIALLYVILAGVYAAAWQIFKRTQVIQRFKTK